jgi:hypothetical protein
MRQFGMGEMKNTYTVEGNAERNRPPEKPRENERMILKLI